MDNCAAAILAGGKSSRMGEDKSALQLNGRTLLEHMRNILTSASIRNIYVSRADFIPDEIAGCGPLGGVHAVMKRSIGQHSHIIFVPVDMPRITSALIQRLIDIPSIIDLAFYAGHTMPFRLSVNKKWIELSEKILRAGDNTSLRNFHASISNSIAIEPASSEIQAFSNINTPDEWHLYTMEDYRESTH